MPGNAFVLVVSTNHLARFMTLPPRLRIPVPLVRRLPAWLTKADPETRTFLSTGRYPTESAREFATLLCEWADNLVEQWSRDR